MSWWRTALNLPPKGEHWADQRRTKQSRTRKAGKQRPQSNTAPEWWSHPDGPVSPTPRQAQGVAAQYSQPQPPNSGGVMAPPRRPQQPGTQPPAGQAPPGQPPGQPPAPGTTGQPPAGPNRQPERLRQRSPHGAHAAPGPVREPILEPNQAPWSTEPESSFSTWARRFFRGLVVAVLLLAAISGVRSWIQPNNPAETVVAGQSGFPADEARAVATRYAVSYLNWDEGNPDARPAQISLDLAAGLDARAGWNGRGKQTADKAYPGEVKVDSGGVTAVVDVRVQIRAFIKAGRSYTPGPYTWQRVSVPVARTSSRVVASGPPTFVADARVALPDNMPEAGAPDDDLTAATMKDAEAFFSAYAESDAKVEAVTAPGAAIRSLNGVVKLGDLKSWQVYTGNDNERRATAAVTWDGAGDTTLDQTYSLTLRRTVAADGAQRWQVAAVG